MKRLILMVFFVLLLASLANADPINLTFPCSGGGQIAATGTIDHSTGAFDIATVISDCAENGRTKNGRVTSNGTLGPSEAVNMTTLYSVTSMDQATGDSVSFNCSQVVSGTYDMPTQEFNGSITSGCNGSGNLRVTLEDALSTLLMLL